MPFVIVETNVTIGRTFDAVLCDPDIGGLPDRRRDLPVQVRLVSERTLLIEPDDARDIVSTVTENSTTRSPGRKAIVESVRRGRLPKTSQLLQQLMRVLTALEPGDNAILST